jgi:hypothetical protein
MNTRYHPILAGLLLANLSGALAATHYVDQNSANSTSPYINWATAATNIPNAVDAAVAGDEIVVTNGTYPGGVSINVALTVRSVSGPQFTTISGGGPCVSLGNGATLTGFTLTNGIGGAVGGALTNCTLSGNASTYYGGANYCTLNNCTLSGNTSSYYGGAYYCTLNNCTLVGNFATYGGGAGWCTLNNCTLTNNSAGYGGGASYSGLNNCTLIGNSAGYVGFGGGASYSTLNNCTLSNNSAGYGGGSDNGTLNNCTLTGNSASYYGGGSFQDTLNNCIVLDGASSSTLNNCWTTEPLFVDRAAGNLRLQSNSPCINAGNNAYAPAGPDLDGNPRIKGGTVDIGAYEFQTPTSIISYAWLQQYGLPTDGSADYADPDHDGMNNWQEWVCGTDPNNALSVLRILAPSPTGTNVVVAWQSVAGVNYLLERSASLTPPAFSTLATNIPGQQGTTSFTDTNATGIGPFFYRVGVGN